MTLTRTSRGSDDELIAALVAVRGIGRWTAEMYLMFQLRRLDVWPIDDLGVRQGYSLAWQLDPPVTAKQLGPLGERFRPYRSIVARYLLGCGAAAASGRHRRGASLGGERRLGLGCTERSSSIARRAAAPACARLPIS